METFEWRTNAIAMPEERTAKHSSPVPDSSSLRGRLRLGRVLAASLLGGDLESCKRSWRIGDASGALPIGLTTYALHEDGYFSFALSKRQGSHLPAPFIENPKTAGEPPQPAPQPGMTCSRMHSFHKLASRNLKFLLVPLAISCTITMGCYYNRQQNDKKSAADLPIGCCGLDCVGPAQKSFN